MSKEQQIEITIKVNREKYIDTTERHIDIDIALEALVQIRKAGSKIHEGGSLGEFHAEAMKLSWLAICELKGHRSY